MKKGKEKSQEERETVPDKIGNEEQKKRNFRNYDKADLCKSFSCYVL
jgi:hypothetical protein